MKRSDEGEGMDPEVERELDAIERALAGLEVDAEMAAGRDARRPISARSGRSPTPSGRPSSTAAPPPASAAARRSPLGARLGRLPGSIAAVCRRARWRRWRSWRRWGLG